MKQRYSKYKQSGVEWIGEIPDHWEVVKLKHLTNVKRGSSPRPIDDPKFFDENGEYYWVRISDVSRSDKFLYYTDEKMSDLGSSLTHKVGLNEVIMSISGSVGKVMITKTKCCIHDGFITFQDPKCDRYFLYYLLTNTEIFVEDGKVGTQTNINSDIVRNKKIPSPPLPEQEQKVK
jgi:type I restriction enzyme S subunit